MSCILASQTKRELISPPLGTDREATSTTATLATDKVKVSSDRQDIRAVRSFSCFPARSVSESVNFSSRNDSSRQQQRVGRESGPARPTRVDVSDSRPELFLPVDRNKLKMFILRVPLRSSRRQSFFPDAHSCFEPLREQLGTNKNKEQASNDAALSSLR